MSGICRWGLADKPKGRRLYRDYLQWLSADDAEQKRLGFEKMTRGWAKGSKEFKKVVLEGIKDKKLLGVKEQEAAELREQLEGECHGWCQAGTKSIRCPERNVYW